MKKLTHIVFLFFFLIISAQRPSQSAATNPADTVIENIIDEVNNLSLIHI